MIARSAPVSLRYNLTLNLKVFCRRVQRRGVATECNLARLLAVQLEHNDDDTAFLAPALPGSNGRTLSTSYSQFWSMVNRYSNCLSHKCNVNKGDRVVCQTSKSVPNIALYYSVLQLGAVYVPVSTDYTHKETKYFIDDSDPKLVVTQKDKCRDDLVPDSTEILDEAQLFDQIWHHDDKLGDHPTTKGTDTAILCYTSGTTGKPKGAMITHGNLCSNTQTLAQYWQMNPKDTLIHALPVNHIHGLCVALNTSLYSRTRLIWMSHLNIPALIDWLPHSTLLMGVPTFYTKLLQSPNFTPQTCRNMRLFICGSAPLLPDIWHEFKERSGGFEILERYGMTEGQMLCSNPCEQGKARMPGTVGQPLPGVKLRLSESGLVEFQSPGLFAGYWRNPEKTAAEFTDDGYFRSGDFGEWVPCADGPYLRVTGRESDMIITGGLNVYPKEIELVLDGADRRVLESAVIGVPHPHFGQAVLAVCAVAHGPSDKDNEKVDSNEVQIDNDDLLLTLKRAVKQELAAYKQPKRILFVNQLPRNTMGKVQKKVLREQFDALFTDAKLK